MTPSRRSLLRTACLVAPMALFVILRLPALIHQAGMQDEHWFAVPGLTVWQEGIPRIPYLPTRNRDTFFENADVCLMTLPPGLFYVQAPFFGIFPAGYATARIPSFLGALLAIGVCFQVCKTLGASDIAAAAAALLVSLSRPLLFTGLTARPDLLAAIAGWISLLFAWRLVTEGERIAYRLAFASGVCSGLGGLFHPFALVFAIQGGLAMLIAGSTLVEKLKRLGLFVCGNCVALSLWTPLIIAYPDEFKNQFCTNVLNRAGPGLFARLAWPIPSMVHHWNLVNELFGFWQGILMLVALIVGSVLFWKTRTISKRERWLFLSLVWSSIFLTATVAGIHTIKWYWIYATIWVIAMAMTGVENWIRQRHDQLRARMHEPWKRIAFAASCAVAFAFAVLLMLPGAGLRTSWIYLTRWKDPDVYAPAFIANVLKDLPKEGTFYVDLSYVFDVYLSGRETRLCHERRLFWGDGPIEYSYLLLSWEGEDAGWASQYGGRHVARIGDASIPQTCYVDLYRPISELDARGGNSSIKHPGQE